MARILACQYYQLVTKGQAWVDRGAVASFLMEGRPEPRITFSDRIDNGIVVGFDDGKTAHYSAALLHASLPQAQTLPSDSEDCGLPQGE